MTIGLTLIKGAIELHNNCVRVLVSLVATDEQVAEALDIFEGAVEQAVGPRIWPPQRASAAQAVRAARQL